MGAIFRVSLDPAHSKDAHGNQLQFLSGVKADLEENGLPSKLNTNVLDQALIEAGSSVDKVSPLDYLLGCWKRLATISRSSKAGNLDEARASIIRNVKRITVSYCFFAVSMPDMFGKEGPAENALAQYLLIDPDNDRGLDQDFLVEAISHLEEDEIIRNTLVEAVEQLSTNLANLSMNDDYRPYMSVGLLSRCRYH